MAFPGHEAANGGTMPRTLFIDDDPYFGSLLGDASGGTAAAEDFLFARSDEEALQLIAAGARIDIAAVAVDSGRVSGMRFFHALKDSPLRVPRIALLSTPDIEAIRRAMNEGAADFLVKPVRLEDLAATLARVFQECERRRAAWRNEAHLSALRREIEVACEIQRRILPSDSLSAEFLDIDARMKPASNMGGDFYDYFELAPDRAALVVADVSGKGIPAAFYMAVVRTLLRASAFLTDTPAECISQVNALLCDHNIPGMFVSVLYAILDTRTGRLHYANGGHMNPLIVGAAGSLRCLDEGGGTVLGVEAGSSYEDASAILEQGETLFLYTDGLTEAFDAERRQYGEDRLAHCLRPGADGAAGLVARVFADVARHVEGAPQSDDITALAVRRL